MRIVGCSTLLLSLLLTGSYAHDAAVCVTDAASPIAPMVPALLMKNGNVIEASGDANGNAVNVMGCCGTCADDSSLYTPQVIGTMPQMTEKQAMEVLEAAKEAWNGGFGVWPQMSLGERITAIENFLVDLRSSRDEIIEILMWEIGKNKPDATAEFDRTVQFIETMISEIQTDPEFNSDWQTIGGTRAFVRRTAIGIIMCLGPYNYPLNETWAMAFAALLAGNVLVLKIPTVGGLCHLLTSKYLVIDTKRVIGLVSYSMTTMLCISFSTLSLSFWCSGCLLQDPASRHHSLHLGIWTNDDASPYEIRVH